MPIAEISAIAAAQGAVGHPFDTVTVGAGDDHGGGEGRDHHEGHGVQAEHGEAGDNGEGYVRADHVNLAMGEVDHADDAVDHGVADGDQGIGTANGQAIDQLL